MSGGISASTALIGGAILGGAYLSSQASKSAAQTQADAANNAIGANQASLEQQMQMTEPWRTAGTTAVNQLSAMTQPGGALTKEFTYDPFSYKQYLDPGYAFRLSEGNKQLNATAAARGGLISGNALKAGEDYGQAAASQEYNNAYSRYLSNYGNAQNTFQMNRNNLVNPLQFLSGQGQASATNTASNIGANAANNAALSTGAANATAAGTVGQANAYTNAVGQGIGAYQTNNLMNLIGNRNTSAYDPVTGAWGA